MVAAMGGLTARALNVAVVFAKAIEDEPRPAASACELHGVFQFAGVYVLYFDFLPYQVFAHFCPFFCSLVLRFVPELF